MFYCMVMQVLLLTATIVLLVVNTAILFVPRDLPLLQAAALLALICAAVNLPCVGLWAVTGDRLRRFLARGRAALVFNATMGALMAGTALWLLLGELIPH